MNCYRIKQKAGFIVQDFKFGIFDGIYALVLLMDKEEVSTWRGVPCTHWREERRGNFHYSFRSEIRNYKDLFVGPIRIRKHYGYGTSSVEFRTWYIWKRKLKSNRRNWATKMMIYAVDKPEWISDKLGKLARKLMP